MNTENSVALCHTTMPKRPSSEPDAEKMAASAMAKQVGERLTMLFDIVGWGQSQVGRLLNVDQSTVNKWLQGTRLQPPYHMVTICQQAGVPLDFIYRGRFSAQMRQDVALRLAAKYPHLVEGNPQALVGLPELDLPAKGAAAAREEA